MKRNRRKRLAIVAIPCAIAFLGYFVLNHLRRRERPDETTGVALELSPAQQVIRVGEIPQLTVTVVNRGTQVVVLVQSGDGSARGWRTPVIEWSPRPGTRGGRCGNINSLSADEVFSLQPGESRQLSSWVGTPHLSGPGRYRAAVRYTNQPDREWVGIPLETHDDAALRAVRGSTAVSAVSNTVEIFVKE